MINQHGSPLEEQKGYGGPAPRLALTEYHTKYNPSVKQRQLVVEIDGLDDNQN